MRDAARAKSDQPEAETRGRIPGLSSMDMLEIALLGEYAREDLDEALRLARRLPDRQRFAALMAVSELLGQF